jgi:hypothetical protein
MQEELLEIEQKTREGGKTRIKDTRRRNEKNQEWKQKMTRTKKDRKLM